MTLLKIILFGFLNLLFCNEYYTQNNIDYGSNNGKYVKLNEVDIYYEEYGEGSPVILLHGGLGSISNFNMIIPQLSEKFKLLPLDSPGHGRSQMIDSLSYNILADYVVKFIHKLNLNQVSIIGYSDGAIIGMLVANKIPDKIDKLVFGAGALGPGISTTEGLKLLQSISPEILPEEFEINYKQKSPNPEDWERFVLSSKKMWLEEIWVPEDILPEIKANVLIAAGDRDQFIPLSHTIKIHDEIPNSELCILPNVGHEIFKNPEILNPILIRFLSQN